MAGWQEEPSLFQRQCEDYHYSFLQYLWPCHRDLALALKVDLCCLQPRHEIVIVAPGLPVLAKVEVLSIVANPNVELTGGIILMEFEEQAGGVERSDCAVEGSNGVAFVLLGDALRGSEVQLGQQRPGVAGMASDRSQLICGGFLDCAVQLLAEHSESRSDHDPCEVAALDERVVLVEHVLEVHLVVVVELGRHRAAELPVRQQSLVQVAHRGKRGLGCCEVEHNLQLCDLKRLLALKQCRFCSHFTLPDDEQIIVVGAVVQDVVQGPNWHRLEAFVQGKLILAFCPQFSREKRSVRRVELIGGDAIRNHPSLFKRKQPVEKGKRRGLRPLVSRCVELHLGWIEPGRGELRGLDVVLLQVGSEVVLLALSD